MPKPSIICVVAGFERGRGTGHLLRSARLVSDLRQRGLAACLCVSGNRPLSEAASLLETAGCALPIDSAPPAHPSLLIVDRFRTPSQEAARYEALGCPVIAVDEGGPWRKRADFAVDLLPNISPHKPNRILLAFSYKNVENAASSPKNDVCVETPILVTFGGEDSAALTETVAASLREAGFVNITTCGPGNYIPRLSERIGKWPLVITHFGLSAFEALAAGCAVLLVPPTKYHEKLSLASGLPSCKPRVLGKTLKQPGFLAKTAKMCAEAAKKYAAESVNYADFVSSLNPVFTRHCPLCRSDCGKGPVFRFPGRTYRHCPKCGLLFQSCLSPPAAEYAEDYFFAAYKKQYGLTYIEDFPNLLTRAVPRLEQIKALLQPGGPRKLLDAGCAYGAFLRAAQDAGFEAHGLDASESAVSFVREKLKISAEKRDFSADFGEKNENFGGFDAITMWFVIEHFEPEKLLFSLKKAAKLLKKGGIFAFSTPSASGVSARKSLPRFLSESPDDHWTIWDPRRVKKALAAAGFRVKKVKFTGHHPERFPLIGRFLETHKTTVLWKLALLVSRLFRLGDTFEVYSRSVL